MDHRTFGRCIVAFQQRAIITDRDEDVTLPSTTNEASANSHPVLEVFLPIPLDYFLCLEFCHIKSKQFMDTHESIGSLMSRRAFSIHEEPYAASAEPTITVKLSKYQQHGQIVLLCLFWRARFHVFRWLITFDLEGREKHGWYKCVGNASLEVR